MSDHIHCAGSPHQHDHDDDHDTVTPGIATAECPVMPGRFVVKAKAEAKGWSATIAGVHTGCAARVADPRSTWIRPNTLLHSDSARHLR